MKTTTVTKYQTSDGRTFSDEAMAKAHEVDLVIDEVNKEDGAPITAAQIKRLMAAHPEKFIDVLKTFTDA